MAILGEAAVRMIHRHRMGSRIFWRVSRLTYSGGRPMAILGWLHDGAARTPGVCVELDPAKLRRGANHRLFFYDEVTVDPRYAPAGR